MCGGPWFSSLEHSHCTPTSSFSFSLLLVQPISQGLLAAYEQDKDSYTFEHQGHVFIVDLKRRVQRNRDKGYVRQLQRRPSYRPLLSMVPHLM